MPFDRFKHHRRSIRLKGYDYRTTGAYFVTICVKGGKCLLGKVIDGEMVLNNIGQIACEEWKRTGELRDHIELDAWIVMPNHFHAIIWLTNEPDDNASVVVGAQRAAPLQQHTAPPSSNDWKINVTPKSLGAVVRAFKSAVTRPVNQLNNTAGAPFWQRNYYEHIIRNDPALMSIRTYINNNPGNWLADQLHPDHPRQKLFVK